MTEITVCTLFIFLFFFIFLIFFVWGGGGTLFEGIIQPGGGVPVVLELI